MGISKRRKKNGRPVRGKTKGGKTSSKKVAEMMNTLNYLDQVEADLIRKKLEEENEHGR